MKLVTLRRLTFVGILFGFLGMFSLAANAIVLVPGSVSGSRHENKEKVNQINRTEIFQKWEGKTLVTESGKYELSSSVKVYDYAHTRKGNQQYEHQPIVDLIYVNNELKRVVIRPCK